MACPICQSKDFYTKNPSDEYDIFEFTCQNGRIEYEDEESEEDAPKMDENPEIFCQRCAWHGKISAVE